MLIFERTSKIFKEKDNQNVSGGQCEDDAENLENKGEKDATKAHKYEIFKDQEIICNTTRGNEKSKSICADEKKDLSENFDPLDTKESCLVFVCICLLGFGAFYAYDAVSALQPHFYTGIFSRNHRVVAVKLMDVIKYTSFTYILIFLISILGVKTSVKDSDYVIVEFQVRRNYFGDVFLYFKKKFSINFILYVVSSKNKTTEQKIRIISLKISFHDHNY